MFKPVRFHAGNVITLPMAGSAVAVKHGLMKMSGGYLVAGASGDNEVEYVALKTVTDVTTVDGSTKVDVIPIKDVIEFDVLCATTPVQATHVGNDYDIGSQTALDLTGTTDKVFHIDSIINDSDKIVRGRFNKPAIA